MTQLAIDRRLTLIAWEAMNHWTDEGAFSVHVFHKNNELAGYCSVLHALQLVGTTGDYGRRLRAAVISFGATARGAVTRADGARRPRRDRADPPQRRRRSPRRSRRRGCVQFERDPDDPGRTLVLDGAEPRLAVAEFLAEHDIVVNCVLQDTDAPLMFVTEDELDALRAREPVRRRVLRRGHGLRVGAADVVRRADVRRSATDVHYYAVDHSPSYLWNSATWEISEALLPVSCRRDGRRPAAWDADETIRRAIEIRDGVIRNPRILSFQDRAPAYPHAKLGCVGSRG